MARVHAQLTLDIYSRLFQEANLADSSRFWDDFFGISILEPALIATFNSVDLTNKFQWKITSLVFTKAVDRILNAFEDSDSGNDVVYSLNNHILVLNAFFKSLRSIITNQSRHYFHQTIAQEMERDIMSDDELITRLCLYFGSADSDSRDQDHTSYFVKLCKVIQKGLSNKWVLRSSLNLMLNTLLVLYPSKYFDLVYDIDLNPQLYDSVIMSPNSEDPLSVIDYNRHFIVLSVLINTRKRKNNNIYKQYLAGCNNESVFKVINTYLYPLIAFNLIILDDCKPDLAIQRSYAVSFFNIITFNKLNRMNYWYRDYLPPAIDDEMKILLKVKQNSFKNSDIKSIQSIESLSLNLVLYAFIVNNDNYTIYLTSHLNENDVEDKPSSSVNNLLDLLLSYSSFIFQHQHNNPINHVITRLNLLIYFKMLTSESPEISNNLLSTTIDQFRYKLCHQSEPYLNNFIRYHDFSSGSDEQYFDEDDIEDSQFKSKMLFMLDVLQCFIRFNMTTNLDLISMKLAVDNILLVLNHLANNYSAASQLESSTDPLEFLFEYNWNDLFMSLFLLLRFLRNDKILYKKYPTKFFALVEEIFVVLTFLLVNGDRLFKYDNYLVELVYKMLEYREVILAVTQKMAEQDGELSVYAQITLSVVYFMNKKFNLTETVKSLESILDFSAIIIEPMEPPSTELKFVPNHDLSYNQISEVLREFIGEIPTTVKTNRLLSRFANGGNEAIVKLDEENIQILIENAQFRETLNYLLKRKAIFNNYKISLVSEGIDLMIKHFESMFK